MKPPRKYVSATAFPVALEDRLKRMAQEEGLDLQRLRRQALWEYLQTAQSLGLMDGYLLANK